MSPRRKARASISKVYSNQRQFKNTSESIDSTLDHGGKVVFFLRSLYGSEKADAILAMVMQRLRPNTDGDIIDLDPVEVDAGFGEGKLPYGFWQHFFKNGLQTQITKSKHMRYHRGFELYLRRRLEGASTKVALRGLRAAGSHRSDGGALNSRKAPGLGVEGWVTGRAVRATSGAPRLPRHCPGPPALAALPRGAAASSSSTSSSSSSSSSTSTSFEDFKAKYESYDFDDDIPVPVVDVEKSFSSFDEPASSFDDPAESARENEDGVPDWAAAFASEVAASLPTHGVDPGKLNDDAKDILRGAGVLPEW